VSGPACQSFLDDDATSRAPAVPDAAPNADASGTNATGTDAEVDAGSPFRCESRTGYYCTTFDDPDARAGDFVFGDGQGASVEWDQSDSVSKPTSMLVTTKASQAAAGIGFERISLKGMVCEFDYKVVEDPPMPSKLTLFTIYSQGATRGVTLDETGLPKLFDPGLSTDAPIQDAKPKDWNHVVLTYSAIQSGTRDMKVQINTGKQHTAVSDPLPGDTSIAFGPAAADPGWKVRLDNVRCTLDP
jgi:hypothetical protein